MLQNKTKTNKENIKAKYGLAFEPAVSLIIFEIKVYVSSAINCIFVGIIALFLVPK